MNFSDINDLDFSNVASWPVAARVVVILAIIGAVLGLGYWFDIKDQVERLTKAEQEEQELRLVFEDKAAKAANLDAYEKQLEEMRESFGAMLRQLPNKTEVADLLVDVSQTGLASGLEFELFKPEGDIPRDFYAELPISIKVQGDFHEFGNFISGVAALPRIVTLHDVKITKQGVQRGKSKAARSTKTSSDTENQLVMQLTAKTYRYLEEDEIMMSTEEEGGK